MADEVSIVGSGGVVDLNGGWAIPVVVKDQPVKVSIDKQPIKVLVDQQPIQISGGVTVGQPIQVKNEEKNNEPGSLRVTVINQSAVVVKSRYNIEVDLFEVPTKIGLGLDWSKLKNSIEARGRLGWELIQSQPLVDTAGSQPLLYMNVYRQAI